MGLWLYQREKQECENAYLADRLWGIQQAIFFVFGGKNARFDIPRFSELFFQDVKHPEDNVSEKEVYDSITKQLGGGEEG